MDPLARSVSHVPPALLGDRFRKPEEQLACDGDTRCLHEAWARGQIAVRGAVAWSDPAVKAILAAYELRCKPEHGWFSYDDLKRDFLGSDDSPQGRA